MPPGPQEERTTARTLPRDGRRGREIAYRGNEGWPRGRWGEGVPIEPGDTQGTGAGHRVLRVYTLGSFRLFRGDEDLHPERWELQKAVSLLKYLVVEEGRWVPSEVLLDLFWPEADADRGLRTLRTAFYKLRHALEPELRPYAPSTYIASSRGRYRFRTESPHWFDFQAFLERARAARQAIERGDRAGAVNHIESALELYGGDFLPEDRYEDWAALPRERLSQEYLELVLRLAQLLRTSDSDTARVLSHLRAAAARAPEREDVQRELMWYLARSGNVAQALRQYDALRRMLREEFGVEPAPETRALYRQLAEGQFAAVPLPRPGHEPSAAPRPGAAVVALPGRRAEDLHQAPAASRAQVERPGPSPGAFVADWPTFRRLVHVERRRLTRWAVTVALGAIEIGAEGPARDLPWDEAEPDLERRAQQARRPARSGGHDRGLDGEVFADWQREVALRLRQGDVVCPVDERLLLVLLPHADGPTADRVMQRLVRVATEQAQKARSPHNAGPAAPHEGATVGYRLFGLQPAA